MEPNTRPERTPGQRLVLVAPIHLRHGWLKHFIKDFETNPQTQYKIHMFFTYFWLCNMALALSVFLFAPAFWSKASVLYLVIVSLYANFATDYGAVSAAEAAHDFTTPPGFEQ